MQHVLVNIQNYLASGDHARPIQVEQSQQVQITLSRPSTSCRTEQTSPSRAGGSARHTYSGQPAPQGTLPGATKCQIAATATEARPRTAASTRPETGTGTGLRRGGEAGDRWPATRQITRRLFSAVQRLGEARFVSAVGERCPAEPVSASVSKRLCPTVCVRGLLRNLLPPTRHQSPCSSTC